MINKKYCLNKSLVYRKEDKNLFYLDKMVVYNLDELSNLFIDKIKNESFSYEEIQLIYNKLSIKIDKEYFTTFFNNLIELKIMVEYYE